MVKSLATPNKYFQGRDVLEELYTYINYIGKRFLVLTDNIVYELIGAKIEKGFAGTDGSCEFVLFGGESTVAEAQRIAEIARDKACQGIIGAGGGKVIDTAKYVANVMDLPVVIIPTAAASDAPCSAMSVTYEEDGTFIESTRTKHNPNVVLVDTQVIAQAPVRLLVAGMGDAFATYYEARACKASGVDNFTGGKRSEAGFAMAELCNQLLLKYGAEAKASVEKKQWSEAVEMIVEANIYLSGVGFENNGCAIAHAIYSGITKTLHAPGVMHGEEVAYGTIVQLTLERMVTGQPTDEEWNQVLDFYRSVGLPMSLKDLGLTVNEEQLLELAKATCTVPNSKKMPFEVTPEVLYKALFRVEFELD